MDTSVRGELESIVKRFNSFSATDLLIQKAQKWTRKGNATLPLHVSDVALTFIYNEGGEACIAFVLKSGLRITVCSDGNFYMEHLASYTLP